MRFLCLFFFIVLIHISSFAQSRYGYETGLDTIARNHHIKRKLIYHTTIRSGVTDTTGVTIFTYREDGFVVKQEDNNLHKTLLNGTPTVSCDFAYNERGYLIGENFYQDGPLPLSGQPIFSGARHTVDNYESGVLRKSISIMDYYFMNDTSQSSKHSTSATYNEKGQVMERVSGDWKETFTYDVNGLLVDITVTTSAPVYQQLYQYEFYETNE